MPAFPKAKPAGEGPSIIQIWALETNGSAQAGGVWAGTIPGGLFYTADGGERWALNEALWNLPEREKWFGGGYDQPGIHTICVDPRDHRCLGVAVSTGGVWQQRVDPSTGSPAAHQCRAVYIVVSPVIGATTITRLHRDRLLSVTEKS